jgi:tetratricopeptide (TPR) repeat protein
VNPEAALLSERLLYLEKKRVAKKEANKATVSGQQNPAKGPGNKKAAGQSSAGVQGYLPYIIIFLFSAALYINTIGNQQAVDDPIVFTSNKFVLQGVSGIKDILTHDASYGFFGDKAGDFLNGGRYRPLGLISFALEVQLFGTDLHVAHAINVLLFALTCLVLFHLLLYLLPSKKDSPFYLSIPFIAAMLFAGHPIHTEAVANIKGRDEIMTLLFSLMALYAAVRYVKENSWRYLAGGAVLFGLGLLSKENAITFVAIVPLTLYFFTNAGIKDYARTVGAYLVPVIIFLCLRAAFTKSGMTAPSNEILNDPFLYLPKGTEGLLQKYATIIMTFLLYIKLLIFPHPLTHDYFYNQVPYVKISNPVFILSLLINGALLVYALLGLRRKSLTSYAILFYFITFSIFSNLFFTVGILMTERFMFMCSVGFCLLVAYLMTEAVSKWKLPAQVLPGVLALILLLYSVKTISRNHAWYDNITLFVTDAKSSTNSSKVSMGVGDEIMQLSVANMDSLRQSGRLQYAADLLELNVNTATTPDADMRKLLLEQGEKYIKASLAIYPGRAPSWLMLGTTAYRLHRPPLEVISYYAKSDSLKPGGDYESLYNIGCVYIENKMPEEAKRSFLKALVVDPKQLASTFNLAVTYMNLKQQDSALIWFGRSIALNPNEPAIYLNMNAIYKEQGNIDGMIQCLAKEMELNPSAVGYYDELSALYLSKKMPDDAIRVSEACLKRFPDHGPAMANIAAAKGMKK